MCVYWWKYENKVSTLQIPLRLQNTLGAAAARRCCKSFSTRRSLSKWAGVSLFSIATLVFAQKGQESNDTSPTPFGFFACEHFSITLETLPLFVILKFTDLRTCPVVCHGSVFLRQGFLAVHSVFLAMRSKNIIPSSVQLLTSNSRTRLEQVADGDFSTHSLRLSSIL